MNNNPNKPNLPLTDNSLLNPIFRRALLANMHENRSGDTPSMLPQRPNDVTIPLLSGRNSDEAQTLARSLQYFDTDASAMSRNGNGDQSTLALANLLRGLQNQTPQQQIPSFLTGSNAHLYQQLLQLQEPPAPTATTMMTGSNQSFAQTLLTALTSQHTSTKLSELSSGNDSAGHRGKSSAHGPSDVAPPPGEIRRTIVVPCRARGMSVDHNFQTAFFEISDDIKHGDGLTCSFPECRNRGVKFLYCAYCKDPVAKRNFRNQHTHAGGIGPLVVPKGSMRKSTTGTTKEDLQTPPISSKISTPKKRKISSQLDDSEGTKSQKSWGVTGVVGGANSNERIATDQKHVSSISDEYTQGLMKLATIEKERRLAWEQLLISRPRTEQNQEMASWLMRVMAVSDLKKPLPEVLHTAQTSHQASSASSSQSQERTESWSNTNLNFRSQQRSAEKSSTDGDSDW